MVYGISTRDNRLSRKIPNKAELPTVSAISRGEKLLGHFTKRTDFHPSHQVKSASTL